MTKDKKLEVRMTEEEMAYIESVCAKNNISKSNFIRQLLNRNGNADVRDILPHIISMQTIVNWMITNGATDELISYMELELNKIWPYLS